MEMNYIRSRGSTQLQSSSCASSRMTRTVCVVLGLSMERPLLQYQAFSPKLRISDLMSLESAFMWAVGAMIRRRSRMLSDGHVLLLIWDSPRDTNFHFWMLVVDSRMPLSKRRQASFVIPSISIFPIAQDSELSPNLGGISSRELSALLQISSLVVPRFPTERRQKSRTKATISLLSCVWDSCFAQYMLTPNVLFRLYQ